VVKSFILELLLKKAFQASYVDDLENVNSVDDIVWFLWSLACRH